MRKAGLDLENDDKEDEDEEELKGIILINYHHSLVCFEVK